MDEYFDRINQISGDVCECFILKVDVDGLHCADVDDNERKVIRFSDLASIENQVHLLELMEWNKTYKVRCIEDDEIMEWTMVSILEEINRDRSGDWQDYDAYDWEEGWNAFVEEQFTYSMKNKNGKNLN